MAAIQFAKGNGNYKNIFVGSNDVGNPNKEGWHIVEAFFDQPKWNGLSGAIKASITNSGVTLLDLINAIFGVSNPNGNTQLIKKSIDGSGWFEVIVSSIDNTYPNQGKVDCNRVRINKIAYDALSANGKAEVNGITLTLLFTTAFN